MKMNKQDVINSWLRFEIDSDEIESLMRYVKCA